MFWVISVYFNIRNTLPKSGTFLTGHPLFSFIQFISYLFREISACCESISYSSELAIFLLQSFQIRWLDLALNHAYSQSSINDQEYKLSSLINKATSQSIDQISVPKRQLQAFNVLSAVSAVLSLRHIVKRRHHNKH